MHNARALELALLTHFSTNMEPVLLRYLQPILIYSTNNKLAQQSWFPAVTKT